MYFLQPIRRFLILSGLPMPDIDTFIPSTFEIPVKPPARITTHAHRDHLSEDIGHDGAFQFRFHAGKTIAAQKQNGDR